MPAFASMTRWRRLIARLLLGAGSAVWNSYHPLLWPRLRYNTNLGGYVVDINQNELEDPPLQEDGAEPGAEPAWGDPDDERNPDGEHKLNDYYGPFWGAPGPL